jgi:hypothetical protein
VLSWCRLTTPARRGGDLAGHEKLDSLHNWG